MTTPAVQIETFPTGALGCNTSIIYVPNTREAIVVDPGDTHEPVLKRVKALGLTVKLLVHTHAHFDHIAGSDRLRDAIKAPILLHKGDLFLYDMLPLQGRYFGFPVDQPGPCDRYIEDEESYSLESGPEKGAIDVLRAIHTPGHTPGSVSFYLDCLGTPILFSGDTLFANSIGRTDLPGGDSDLILQSIRKRLLVLPDETICIPGHGPKTRLYEEKRSNPFLA